MASQHLSCEDCRIRVRESAPEIELLDGKCPVCGAKLKAVASPSDVIGFRSFDLDMLAAEGPNDRLPAQPVDLVARRAAASGRDGFDADRWSDEGGSVRAEAAVGWPAASWSNDRPIAAKAGVADAGRSAHIAIADPPLETLLGR